MLAPAVLLAGICNKSCWDDLCSPHNSRGGDDEQVADYDVDGVALVIEAWSRIVTPNLMAETDESLLVCETR